MKLNNKYLSLVLILLIQFSSIIDTKSIAKSSFYKNKKRVSKRKAHKTNNNNNNNNNKISKNNNKKNLSHNLIVGALGFLSSFLKISDRVELQIIGLLETASEVSIRELIAEGKVTLNEDKNYKDKYQCINITSKAGIEDFMNRQKYYVKYIPVGNSVKGQVNCHEVKKMILEVENEFSKYRLMQSICSQMEQLYHLSKESATYIKDYYKDNESFSQRVLTFFTGKKSLEYLNEDAEHLFNQLMSIRDPARKGNDNQGRLQIKYEYLNSKYDLRYWLLERITKFRRQIESSKAIFDKAHNQLDELKCDEELTENEDNDLFSSDFFSTVQVYWRLFKYINYCVNWKKEAIKQIATIGLNLIIDVIFHKIFAIPKIMYNGYLAYKQYSAAKDEYDKHGASKLFAYKVGKCLGLVAHIITHFVRFITFKKKLKKRKLIK